MDKISKEELKETLIEVLEPFATAIQEDLGNTRLEEAVASQKR